MSFLADGVAVLNAGLFESNDSFTAALFDDAFTDIQPTPAPNADYMPFAADIRVNVASALASKWFQHREPANLAFQPNVIHRISAASAYLDTNADLSPRVELGYTAHDTTPTRWNFSFTFVGRIEQATTQSILFHGQAWRNIVYGLPTTTVEGKTTDHELVHIWQPAHCGYNRYQDARDCLMHYPASTNKEPLSDSVIGLHYVNHGASSEYLDIRTATDPF